MRAGSSKVFRKVMVASYLNYFFLLHYVSAACTGAARGCKEAPAVFPALVLVQHHVAIVEATSRNEQAVDNKGISRDELAQNSSGHMRFVGTLKPTQTAQQFNSPECQREIANVDFDHWSSMVRPDFFTHMGKEQQARWNEQKKIMYVRNQKVASTLLFEEQSNIFRILFDEVRIELDNPLKQGGAHAAGGVGVAYRINERGHKDGEMPAPGADQFVYSVVRDPIETALASYLEIARRDKCRSCDQTKRFRDMPCDNQTSATNRAKAFFNQVREGKPFGEEFFHAYPQAVKLNIARSPDRGYLFDAIGRLEHFEDDMKSIQIQALDFGADVPYDRLAPPPVPKENDADLPPSGSTQNEECHDIDMHDSELISTLCELYKVDFVCFAYKMPELCQTSTPSSRTQ